LKIVNHVIMGGRELILEFLPLEERESIERALTRRMIEAAGGGMDEEDAQSEQQAEKTDEQTRLIHELMKRIDNY